VSISEPSNDELLALLDLQSIGEGVFSGPPAPDIRGRVFGGQILAQALAAACFTAPQGWPCHSLHAYFLRPGKPARPIEYEVSTMRDGQRFAARKVLAVQRDEIDLELIASFERTEPGAEYQVAMPDVAAPETFPPEDERIARLVENATPEQREVLERKWPIEFIRIDPIDAREQPPPTAAIRKWMRVRGRLPDDPNLHRCALAYASDFGALEPSVRAIGMSLGDTNVQVASLDHALWFHRPFRFDEWLLFSFESASVAGGRGLNHGSVYSRDGRLVASLMQEALLRPRDETAAY
jgi:acyl-CoA thioesterase-2